MRSLAECCRIARRATSLPGGRPHGRTDPGNESAVGKALVLDFGEGASGEVLDVTTELNR